MKIFNRKYKFEVVLIVILQVDAATHAHASMVNGHVDRDVN